MKIVRTKENLQKEILEVKEFKKSIGLVPTMGCLHEGHLSLVKQAREETDFVVVTIFVNPTQFAEGEDLDKYPRTEKEDLLLLKNNNADLVFIPDAESMYKKNSSTYVIEDNISQKLCGKYRPTHFKGVLTIVAKLLNLSQPDKLFMGQKDYQQAILIKKMIEELDYSAELVICPIIRKLNGIALSSRNRYLCDKDKANADLLFHNLESAKNYFLRKYNDGKSLKELVLESKIKLMNDLDKISGFEVQYAEVLDAENLFSVNDSSKVIIFLIAGFFNTTRLIDNIIVKVS